MDSSRLAVFAVAVLIVGLVLATGPIGLITIPTAESGFEELGTGNATVHVTSSPDVIPLRAGDTGQDLYYLDVPPTIVEVRDLQGNPHLNYRVAIPALGYSTNSVTPLKPRGNGLHHIEIERGVFNASRITETEYEAELELVFHWSGGERVLFDRTVMVEVRE